MDERVEFAGGAYFATWTPPPCDCGEDTCALIEPCCRHNGVACSIHCTAVNPWAAEDAADAAAAGYTVDDLLADEYDV